MLLFLCLLNNSTKDEIMTSYENDLQYHPYRIRKSKHILPYIYNLKKSVFMKKIFFLLLCLPLISVAQKKQITLDDIYKTGTFRAEFVAGFESEKLDSYLKPENVKDENGKPLSVNDFTLSADKKRVIISINREKIYRHSSKALVYIHDIASQKTTKLDNAKVLHASFSPDGNKLAFVKDNNLFIYDINT